MEDGFLIELLLVGVLIVLNGFFSGAEIAVITARRGRLQVFADAGHRGAEAALRLKSDPDRFLATVQIGVTVVGTLASAVGGVAAIERLEPVLASLPWGTTLAEPLAVGIVVFAIAYLSLVVGELIPKSIAVRHAETIALAVARPIDWLSRVSGRVVGVLTASTRMGLRLLGQRDRKGSPFHTMDDLRALVEEAEAQGMKGTDLLTGAFAFHERAVREVMTPRPRIVAIRRSATVREARRIVAESGHSRFPAIGVDLDDVAGVLLARDLYGVLELDPEGSVEPLIQGASFVPQGKKATELLTEMRTARRQMTFVVDEHGGLLGLITIEDLVEVIVGEIPDEHHVPEGPPATVVQEGIIEADGSITIPQLNEDLDLELPESPSYVTLGGLVLERLGALPRGGETVDVPPYRLTVTSIEGRRIARVRIVSAEAPAARRAKSPTPP